MDRKATLAAFDRQMRRSAHADGSGARIEDASAVVRYVSADREGWSAVIWSALDEASADRVIAEQIAYFAGLGHAFEWKHYAYDRPADLPARLLAAGLEPGAEEALLVAEVADLVAPTAAAALPPGVRLIEARDEASVGLVVRVHEEVFGVEHAWLGRALLTQLERAPDAVAAFVAMVGERPVSSARVEFHRGTDFASLWGGGTLPEFRGRGIYRALVARRARLAAERGFRYLQVDALPTSRPTLERLGFTHLTNTTPYGWRPPGRER